MENATANQEEHKDSNGFFGKKTICPVVSSFFVSRGFVIFNGFVW
jgi:hypothetical protein